MEKGTNDRIIDPSGVLNLQQRFFIQRWLEILNHNTHSSYYIKYLNSHLALLEVLTVSQAILEGFVHKNHLKTVIEEARSIIEKDIIFPENAEPQYKLIQTSLQSVPNKDSEIHALVYQIKNVLKDLSDRYLEWIIQRLEKRLFSQESNDYVERDKFFEELDYLITTLVSELLGKGWSIESLYGMIHRAVKDRRLNEESFWAKVFQMMKSKPYHYICLFPVESEVAKDLYKFFLDTGLRVTTGKQILDEFPIETLKGHLSEAKSYLMEEEKAYDYYSAINLCWEKIMKHYDLLRFYGVRLPKLNTKPIVIFGDRKRFIRGAEVSIFHIGKNSVAPISLIEQVLSIFKSDNKMEYAKKLKSIFEFSRISEESLSPQSTFLNLWIALESFVQTKEYEGNIESIKNNVGCIVSARYIYRLIRNFYEDCLRCGVELDNIHDKAAEPVSHHRKVFEMLRYLTDPQLMPELNQKCSEKNTLLGFRCRRLVHHLASGRNAAKLIERHKQNVTRHLQRLYRIRNEIVHAGTSRHNLGLFTRHLREYVEMTVTEVVYRLNQREYFSLDEVFSWIRNNQEATVEVLKQSDSLNIEDYRKLLLEGVF